MSVDMTVRDADEDHPREIRRAACNSPGSSRCIVQRRWRAMGTDAHLVVVGTTAGTTNDGRQALESLADAAVDRISELEARWSRFLPSSEISVLNRDGWAAVSPETFALIDRAIAAWRETGGRFDPLQLRQLQQLGYDRPFDRLDRPFDRLRHPAVPDRPAPEERADDVGAPVDSLPTGCAGIVLDPYSRTVVLPGAPADATTGPTPMFDPGGIGKGFAADLVVEELLAAGAAGALVNLGGDLRVEGVPPAGCGWVIEIGEDAWSKEPPAVLELELGGVATSTPLRRRWAEGAHHLLDPATGRPAEHGPALVTAIAGEAWWAEAAATALAVGGRPGANAASGAPRRLANVATLTVDFDGTMALTGGFERFARRLSDAAVVAATQEDGGKR